MKFIFVWVFFMMVILSGSSWASDKESKAAERVTLQFMTEKVVAQWMKDYEQVDPDHWLSANAVREFFEDVYHLNFSHMSLGVTNSCPELRNAIQEVFSPYHAEVVSKSALAMECVRVTLSQRQQISEVLQRVYEIPLRTFGMESTAKDEYVCIIDTLPEGSKRSLASYLENRKVLNAAAIAVALPALIVGHWLSSRMNYPVVPDLAIAMRMGIIASGIYCLGAVCEAFRNWQDDTVRAGACGVFRGRIK